MSSPSYPWIIAALAVLIAIGATVVMLNTPVSIPADGADPDAPATLVHLQAGVAGELETLDGRVAQAAFEIGHTGLNDDAARGILTELSGTDPAVVDCVIVDAEGTIIAAEPAAYRGAEGSDISDQEHVQRILATKRPVVSEVITVVEGFPAVVIAAPVFTSESQFAGFVAAVVQPEVLIGGVAEPAVTGTSYQVMVVQTDGRVLSDTDPAQTGRMTFDDPLYADSPGLQDAARRVTSERYSTATYEFAAGGKDAVQKGIIWTTTGLHGTEWRVAVIWAIE
ncbi:MAG: cache domain-containing protein [Methanoculleus sp.]